MNSRQSLIRVAKMDQKLVQVVTTADTVSFSPDRGWILICFDWEQAERRRSQYKWVPATTRFEWVREYIVG